MIVHLKDLAGKHTAKKLSVYGLSATLIKANSFYLLPVTVQPNFGPLMEY